MPLPEMPSGHLPDLSSFAVNTKLVTTRTGSTLANIRAHRPNASFLIELSYPFNPDEHTKNKELDEPDTAYLEWVGTVGKVPQLGSAAIAEAVRFAKENWGVSRIRADILHPRVIGILQNLQSLEIVRSSFYRVIPPGENDSEPVSSNSFLAAKGVVGAASAVRELEAHDARIIDLANRGHFGDTGAATMVVDGLILL